LAQVLFVFLLGLVFLIRQPVLSPRIVAAAAVFFAVYGFGGAVHSGYLVLAVEAAFGFGLTLLLLSASDREIRRTSTLLVAASVIFTAMVALAWSWYLNDPSILYRADLTVFDSTVGSSRVIANHPVNYFSFFSGDGFVAADQVRPRLKGFSNEPSSTPVHYLAPAILALLLRRRWRLAILGFVVAVNALVIASVVTLLIVVLGLGATIAVWLFRRWARHAALLAAAAGVVVLLNLDIAIQIQQQAAQIALDVANVDLLARKGGSLEVRLDGILNGVRQLAMSPLGWNATELGAGAGVLFTLSAYGGWLGVIGVLVGAHRLMRRVWMFAALHRRPVDHLAVGLVVSMLFISLTVSGYGWDRLPGLVMYLLIFRLLGTQALSQIPAAELPHLRRPLPARPTATALPAEVMHSLVSCGVPACRAVPKRSASGAVRV
jgi:hypothetical protein